MGEAIEQGGCHLGITEDCGPCAETVVGGDHHACALVKFAEQVKEQRRACRAERQVTQLVQDHEVELGHGFRDLPGRALDLSCSRMLTSSMVEKKRTFRRWCWIAWMPSAVAI